MRSPSQLGVTALGQVFDVQHQSLQLANNDQTYVCLIQDHDVSGKFGKIAKKVDHTQSIGDTDVLARFSFFLLEPRYGIQTLLQRLLTMSICPQLLQKVYRTFAEYLDEAQMKLLNESLSRERCTTDFIMPDCIEKYHKASRNPETGPVSVVRFKFKYNLIQDETMLDFDLFLQALGSRPKFDLKDLLKLKDENLRLRN